MISAGHLQQNFGALHVRVLGAPFLRRGSTRSQESKSLAAAVALFGSQLSEPFSTEKRGFFN